MKSTIVKPLSFLLYALYTLWIAWSRALPALQGMGMAVFAVVLLWLLPKKPVRRLSPRDAVLALLLGLAFFLAGRRGAPAPLPPFLLAAVLAPLCEETLFRGLLANAMPRPFPFFAPLAVALLFALAHRGTPLRSALFSLAASALCAKSRGLAAPILMHAAANGLYYLS